MGKIIMQQFITLDGVMQAPGDLNEFEYGGWQLPYVGEEHLTLIVEQAYAVEALLIHGDATEEAAKLKQELRGDLLVVGSGDLAQTLMNNHLIDEYRLWVHPVILGRGQRLFRGGSEKAAMRLMDSKALKSGVTIHTYQPEIMN